MVSTQSTIQVLGLMVSIQQSMNYAKAFNECILVHYIHYGTSHFITVQYVTCIYYNNNDNEITIQQQKHNIQ